MRGFSYASMWMESLKNPQKNQHNIQKACTGTCMKTIIDNIFMLNTYYIHYVCACVMTYNNYIYNSKTFMYM